MNKTLLSLLASFVTTAAFAQAAAPATPATPALPATPPAVTAPATAPTPAPAAEAPAKKKAKDSDDDDEGGGDDDESAPARGGGKKRRGGGASKSGGRKIVVRGGAGTPCRKCAGTGEWLDDPYPTDPPRDCLYCDGAGEVPAWRPPSEKESGVRLTIPITRGLAKSMSKRLVCQIMRFVSS